MLMALGAIVASLSVGSNMANAQFLPFWFGQGVVLEASDIYDEGVAAQSLRVTYYDQINVESLGDDEIWVVSPDGFNALAKLEGYEEVMPDDALVDPDWFARLGLINETGDPLLPWLSGPAIAARYSLSAPNGEAWTADDNGSYSVLIAPESVSYEQGGYLEHQLLGTFGVRVGEPLPVQVDDWSVNVVESNGGCKANVRIKFESATEVEWGEVMRDGERLFVRIEAKTTENGAKTASHSYPLGDLPPGQYLFEVRVNDRLLDVTPFKKRDIPLRVPAETTVSISQGPAQPLMGNVMVQFLEPGWSISNAGEVQRKGNRFFVDAKASFSPDAAGEEVWEMGYEIPEPEPGIYTFTFCLNGQVCNSSRFEIAGPDGTIRVRNVTVAFTGAIACPEDEEGGNGDCFYDHVASVSVALSPQVAVVNWGEPVQEGRRKIIIDIETAEVPAGEPEPEPDGLNLASHRYDLGLLEEGRWTLQIESNGKRLAREIFISPASSGLKAQLRTAPLDPSAQSHEFSVTYSGLSPVDVESLGDDDIKVTNPIIHAMDFQGPIPVCLSQFAKLVSYEVAADGGPTMAIYSITCPEGNWEASDFAEGLEVYLVDGGVSTVSGLKAEGRHLGYIPFKKNTFDLRADANEVFIHEPVETAVVDVSYRSSDPIDVESLGDGDIAIFQAELIAPDGSVETLSEPLIGTLQDYSAAGGNRRITAKYAIAPADGWTSRWNGHFILTLVGGELSNEDGQVNEAQDIGLIVVDIEPDLVIGEAEIKVRADGDKVLADVTTALRSHKILNWGKPVLEGNTFFLDASADPADQGSNQGHTYQLLPRVVEPEEEPIDFEALPDDAAFPLYLPEPLEFVVRSEDEWKELIVENWHPLADANIPPAPVDFSTHMLVGAGAGTQPDGIEIQVSQVVIASGKLVVRYDLIYPGVEPPDDMEVMPYEIVAIPQIDLPVVFEQGVIALPGPAPEDGLLPAGEGGDPLPGRRPFPVPPNDNARLYWVVFRVNGQTLARTQFSRPDAGGILARAWIDIETNATGAVAAVNVKFPGYPYHHIVDWGNVRREGNAFFLPAKAEQIDFIVDPGVVEQSHRYKLDLSGTGGGGGSGEVIPFEPIELENWNAVQPRNLVIQTADEWAEAWSSTVPIDSLPPAPPIDLNEFTLLGVLQGARPNGCYDVRIVQVAKNADGTVTVSYESILPQPGEVCTEAIVYPQSFVAVPKIAGPVDFVEIGSDAALGLPAAGFRIILPFPEQYEVFFLINDVVYARTSFGWRRPIPEPEPRPVYDVAIDAEGGEGKASVKVTLFSPDGVINNVQWGDASVNGHSVKANAVVDFTPWEDLLNVDPAAQEPVEHTYKLVDLRGGFHTFRFSINGKQTAHAFFMVQGGGFKPLPFDKWLAGLVAEVRDATKHGLAEALGDLDGDGMLDMEEFFLGTDPLVRDTPFVRPEWIDGTEGKSHLAICFKRRKSADGVVGVVEASGNLRQWNNSPELFEEVSITDLGDGLEEVVICLKEAASSSPFRFLRLRMQGVQ